MKFRWWMGWDHPTTARICRWFLYFDLFALWMMIWTWMLDG